MSQPKKLLLVDDDAAFVESNRELLEAFGYEVLTAYDGDSGLEMARQEKPDLMILDVMMTTNDEGFEVARKISKDPDFRGMRVLLLTGISRALSLPDELKPDTTWLPVDRVLEKPIDPSQLIDEVERLLGEEAD